MKDSAANRSGPHERPTTLLSLVAAVLDKSLASWTMTLRLSLILAVAVGGVAVGWISLRGVADGPVGAWAAVILSAITTIIISRLRHRYRKTSGQRRSGLPADHQLIQLVGDIESTARITFHDEGNLPPGGGLTVASLLPALERSGKWSPEDVLRFKEVMRLRNKIVHSAADYPSRHDILGAIDVAESLHEKLRRVARSKAEADDR